MANPERAGNACSTTLRTADGDAGLDGSRAQLGALLREACAYRWAAPLGAALALGTLAVSLGRLIWL